MSCRGSETTTRYKGAEVCVSVSPVYVSSTDDDEKHWFSYTITIANQGAETVQLRSRFWRISDSNNLVREVKGDGVVGEQPRIGSGEKYQYTSYVDLDTPSGDMEGYYTLEKSDGEHFDADIGVFLLSLPGALQ